MSEEDTRFYLAEIVLAVENLHERRIIYRDLKPENILVEHYDFESNGHKVYIKLADFGFACQGKEMYLSGECGTPGYKPPELYLGPDYYHDYKVDVWSFGVIAF